MSKRKRQKPAAIAVDSAKPSESVAKVKESPSLKKTQGKVSDWRFRAIGAALFLLVFLVFLPAVTHGFFAFDDQDYVTNNPHVKGGLKSAEVAWSFTTGHAGNWHPLTWISHMIDCQMYALKPWGHHLTAILLHSANALLLFIALRRMTGAFWRSLIVAILFGIHPLRVESVAWVAERKDVLSTFFWMLTILTYVRYTEERKVQSSKAKGWYVVTLLLFACGLMSKPMLVTLPCALMLLDLWPLRRIGIWRISISDWRREGTLTRAVVEKVPMFAMAAVTSIVTLHVQEQMMSENVALILQLENAVVAYCRYIGKVFWPEGLVPFYPHPLHWPAALVAVCIGILLAISALAFFVRKRQAWFTVGWCWFLGTLVPAIGIVQVGSQSMADRYTYVPTIGILIIAVWGSYEFVRQSPRAKLLAGLVAGAVILTCAVLTEKQLGYWKDNEVLLKRTMDLTKGNVVAMTSLGEVVAARGRRAEAIGYYREALNLQPKYFEALLNLGNELSVEQRLDEAATVLRRAIQVQPHNTLALNSLGSTLSDEGKFDEAIEQFKEALRLRPDYANAEYNWGLAMARQRRFDEAIQHFKAALRMDPYQFAARNNLAIVFYAQGKYDEAIGEFKKALEIKPGDKGVLENIKIVEDDKAKAAARPPGSR